MNTKDAMDLDNLLQAVNQILDVQLSHKNSDEFTLKLDQGFGHTLSVDVSKEGLIKVFKTQNEKIKKLIPIIEKMRDDTISQWEPWVAGWKWFEDMEVRLKKYGLYDRGSSSLGDDCLFDWDVQKLIACIKEMREALEYYSSRQNLVIDESIGSINFDSRMKDWKIAPPYLKAAEFGQFARNILERCAEGKFE